MIYELGSKGGRDSDRGKERRRKKFQRGGILLVKVKVWGGKIPRDMVFSPVSLHYSIFILT